MTLRGGGEWGMNGWFSSIQLPLESLQKPERLLLEGCLGNC